MNVVIVFGKKVSGNLTNFLCIVLFLLQGSLFIVITVFTISYVYIVLSCTLLELLLLICFVRIKYISVSALNTCTVAVGYNDIDTAVLKRKLMCDLETDHIIRVVMFK